MKQLEVLKDRIEAERRVLDGLLERGSRVDEIYRQSLVVDNLIVQYIALAEGV